MHVITGLEVGGAEKMLLKLLAQTSHPSVVVSLKTEGVLGKEINRLGIPVHTLNLSRNLFSWRKISQLTALVDKYRPGVIQSWLYASDLIAGYAASRTDTPLLWNIRQSETGWIKGQWHIAINQRINARLSGKWPRKILFCGDEAYKRHVKIGYVSGTEVVIPNGIDTTMFKPDSLARRRLRRQWKINDATCLVGMVGRYDPLKNHTRFLEVLSQLKSRSNKAFHAILVGRGVDHHNRQLCERIKNLNLEEHCSLLGERDDISDIMNTLDLYLLTSDSEGWPNVLGEAMACGKTCIATDVGDVAKLLGSTGYVVGVNEITSFVDACERVLNESYSGREELGQKARSRIIDRFSLTSTVEKYDEIYSSYLGKN